MILNQVYIDLVVTCGPILILSKSGKGEPFTFSPLIGFLINGAQGLMTPLSQHLTWPYAHGLICIVAAYNFLIHGQYLCNTGMLDWYQGNYLSQKMVWGSSYPYKFLAIFILIFVISFFFFLLPTYRQDIV